jgi:hypothetical protein
MARCFIQHGHACTFTYTFLCVRNSKSNFRPGSSHPRIMSNNSANFFLLISSTLVPVPPWKHPYVRPNSLKHRTKATFFRNMIWRRFPDFAIFLFLRWNSVKYWSNASPLTGETKVLSGKTVPWTICPQHITNRLPWFWNTQSAVSDQGPAWCGLNEQISSERKTNKTDNVSPARQWGALA